MSRIVPIDIIDSLPRGNTPYRKRDLMRIKRIVIHHTAGDSQKPNVYARFHVEDRGWPGIGYHFMVSSSGDVYKTNPLDVASYNVANMNTSTVGICLMGNFDKYSPQEDQVKAAAELVKSLRVVIGQVPVVRHRDVGKTSCPGNNFPWEKFLEYANI